MWGNDNHRVDVLDGSNEVVWIEVTFWGRSACSGGWCGEVGEDETAYAKVFGVDGAGISWGSGWSVIGEVGGVVEELFVVDDDEWLGELMIEMFGSNKILVKSLSCSSVEVEVGNVSWGRMAFSHFLKSALRCLNCFFSLCKVIFEAVVIVFEENLEREGSKVENRIVKIVLHDF